jgi:hypothetical protein
VIGRSRRAALLTVLSLLLIVCLLVPGETSAHLFALLAVALPVVLIALAVHRPAGPVAPEDAAAPGAARVHGRVRGRVRSRGLGGGRALGLSLVLLLMILEGAVIGVLRLSGVERPAVAGLPPAAVVQLVGLWLLPLPLVALAYALTFDRSGITREDLEALRRRVRRKGTPQLEPRPETGPSAEPTPDPEPDPHRPR